MRKPVTLTEQVRRRIRSRGAGTVFSPSDFLDLGARAAVDQALSRLSKEGLLRRLRRGVYDYPRVNEQLGITLTPVPEAVARALARGQKSDLQVTGAQAANLLGLSEQVPARVVFLTNGATGKVKLGNQTIELRHASPRSMRAAGKVSGTVIQALRHLGKGNVTPEIVSRLRETFTPKDKRTIRRDVLLAPGWMQPLLATIAAEEASTGEE